MGSFLVTIEIIDVDAGMIRFRSRNDVYTFFSDGTYVCRNSYFENGERSLWKFENNTMHFSHPWQSPNNGWAEWFSNDNVIEIVREWFSDEILLG